MIHKQACSRLLTAGAISAAVLLFGSQAKAQDSQVQTAHNVDQHVADGQRHGLPLETYAVVPGTRFLVSLEQDLNTKDLHPKPDISRTHGRTSRSWRWDLPTLWHRYQGPHQPSGTSWSDRKSQTVADV